MLTSPAAYGKLEFEEVSHQRAKPWTTLPYGSGNIS